MMKKLCSTFVLVTVFMSVLATRVEAQTVTDGPYYSAPAWDQTLACNSLTNCPRFIVLSNMNSEAVLDRETGLVWERSPSATPLVFFAADQFFAAQAAVHCNFSRTGDRGGWRLPSVQELASLVDADPANTSSPRLPPGHPFQNVQSAVYWSATQFGPPNPVTGRFGWEVSIGTGVVNLDEAIQPHFVWCVRDDSGLDTQ